MSERQTRDAAAQAELPLINGAFEVDCRQPLPDAGGGLEAFAVIDHRSRRRGLMAVQVPPGMAARPLAMTTLSTIKIDNILLPLAHGAAMRADGREAWFVISPRPGGPPILGAARTWRPWSDRDLLDGFLRPTCLALDQLAAAGITHRAIRPANLFRAQPGLAPQPDAPGLAAQPGLPVTLGAAWSAPPAMFQPAVFEPPYSAMCHRAGRGEGTIADDIYALGVMLLSLALGRIPLEEMDEDAQIRLKLDRGSFAALAGDSRLSPTITDLARGMLAEDPEHRTQPLLLADPVAARGRRVAARPPQRASRPIEVAGVPVWEARSLAYAIARAPEQGLALLRNHTLPSWLRRILGDPTLSNRIGDMVQAANADPGADPAKADATLILQAVAILDPLAPICWQGLTLFPDGLGGVVAATGSGTELIEAMVISEAPARWGDLRPDRTDPAVLRLDMRHHRVLLQIPGWSGGMARLRYALNPLLPCRAPLLGAACVVRLQDLLVALDRAPPPEGGFVIDREIAAFISARFNGRMDADFTILAQTEDPDIDPPGHRGLAQLRILARLAASEPGTARPNLTTAILPATTPAVSQWRSRQLRAARGNSLAAAAQRGLLPGMLAVLQEPSIHQEDAKAAQAAAAELRLIDQSLGRLSNSQDTRARTARANGEEIAACIAVAVLAASAIAAAL